MRTRALGFVLLALVALTAPGLRVRAQEDDRPGPRRPRPSPPQMFLDPVPPPFFRSSEERSLPRHAGDYGPTRVSWQTLDKPAGVLGVYPHPLLPRRVLLATAAGLFLSDDAGQNWQALTEAAPARLGAVRQVAFIPDLPDAFYLATDRKGVWRTDDAGQTIRPAGDKAAGLAADETLGVLVHPGDRRFETVLAWHGRAAPGISRSYDGGKTWRVVGETFFVHQVQDLGPGREDFYVAASTGARPDVVDIRHCASLDDFWADIVSDVVPADSCLPVLREDGGWGYQPAYYASADRGLLRVSPHGRVRVGPPTADRFLSVGAAWDATADGQLFYAYEPRTLGLILSRDQFETWTSQSQGLLTGQFVSDGSHVRAAPDGSVFYAVINQVLHRGTAYRAGAPITEVTVSPPAFDFEQDRPVRPRALAPARFRRNAARPPGWSDVADIPENQRLAISAHVGTPQARPVQVSVDLSRLGYSPRTPMLDDGRHDDGAAGDGIYAAAVAFDPARARFSWEARRSWPGRVGLTITAVDRDGTLSGAVGVLGLYEMAQTFTFYDDHGALNARAGTVKGLEGPEREAFTGGACLKFTAGPGEWSVAISGRGNSAEGLSNIGGYHAMSFWIKATGPAGQDVQVQLQDAPPYSNPSLTGKVAVVQNRLIAGGRLGEQWNRAVVPMTKLLAEPSDFAVDRCARVVLSGDSSAPTTIWVDLIRFYVSAQDLNGDPPTPGPRPRPRPTDDD